MTRAEVNRILREGEATVARMGFKLPPFATWSAAEWERRGPECREIVEQQLGWDITDFGSGDFLRVGLLLFTIRNGTLDAVRTGRGKSYAEKIMVVQPEQVTCTHFHFQKMEDIINRGGGNLMMQVWNATPDDRLADSEVVLSMDGIATTLKAGMTLRMTPGESVCLPPRLYHSFWGEKGKGTVLVGEVSRVNDDHIDNRFLEPVGRFPDIEEDEPPYRLLVGDYPRHYRHIRTP